MTGLFLFLFTFAYFSDSFLTSDWPDVRYPATSLAEMYCSDFMVRLLETDLVRDSVAKEQRVRHHKLLNFYDDLMHFTQGQRSVVVNI